MATGPTDSPDTGADAGVSGDATQPIEAIESTVDIDVSRRIDPSEADEGGVAGMLSEAAFDVVMRGYARHQVDAYLHYSDRVVADLHARLTEVETELAEAREQLAEHDTPSYAGLGARVNELLRLAEEEAREIREHARTEMQQHRERILSQARDTAAAVIDTARRDTHRIRAELDSAKADLDRQRRDLDTRLTYLRRVLTDAPVIDPDTIDTHGAEASPEDASPDPQQERSRDDRS